MSVIIRNILLKFSYLPSPCFDFQSWFSSSRSIGRPTSSDFASLIVWRTEKQQTFIMRKFLQIICVKH